MADALCERFSGMVRLDLGSDDEEGRLNLDGKEIIDGLAVIVGLELGSTVIRWRLG